VNQAALLQRFDCVPISGERSNYLIILQAAQDWIAPERISVKLVILLHVREQILLGFCQLGRDAAGLFFGISPVQFFRFQRVYHCPLIESGRNREHVN
jgi:hypothetical protein